MYRDKELSNDIKVREILANEENSIIRKFYYKRRLVKHCYLKGKIIDQLKGYTLIDKDLRSIIAWQEEIQNICNTVETPLKGMSFSGDRHNFNIVKSLWVSSLAFYAKCFVSSNGRKIKLGKEWIKTEFLDEHNTYMGYRHNFAAHAGSSDLESCDVILLLHPKKNGYQIFRGINQADFASPISGITLIEICKDLQKKTEQKINNITNLIFEKEVLPKGTDFWNRKSNTV